MDICSNYPTSLFPSTAEKKMLHTYLAKVLIDGCIHHSLITGNMNDTEAILDRMF